MDEDMYDVEKQEYIYEQLEGSLDHIASHPASESEHHSRMAFD